MTKKAKKAIIITCSVLVTTILLFFLIIPFTASALIYNGVFGQRFETTEHLRYNVEDFDGLCADRYEFSSNNGQTLVGYRYYITEQKPKAVLVIAHGFGGGGHNSYMDVAYFFAQHGYNAFAYDATGNDESQGKSVNGLPQGVIDLSNAIDFVKTIPELKNLPITLFGHSWGGYCVGTVLNFHPEVKAIVSFAGFNKSSDLLQAQGKEMIGNVINFAMPYVNSIENIKFGKYAKATAMGGFENSEAGVFVVHSQDDTTVPIQYGYDVYYSKYADNSRFQFVKYQDKGHSNILYSYASINYIKEFNATAKAHFDGLDASQEEIIEYIKQNLDRKIYCDMLDKELFENIVEFFNSYL